MQYVSWQDVWGTQNTATAVGALFAPATTAQRMFWSLTLPTDWDGTSAFVFRHRWAQWPAGAQKDATCCWDFQYWVMQDWDNVIGSKSHELSATYVYGDEGTTNYALHCGTFAMDLTSGTFGTVEPGHLVMMQLWMPNDGTNVLGSAVLFEAKIEYMATMAGAGAETYTTIDKRGG